jgi:hypothetical protein
MALHPRRPTLTSSPPWDAIPHTPTGKVLVLYILILISYVVDGKIKYVVAKEIQARLKAGSRCYYALQAALKSRRISRKVKLNIYKTTLKPIVTYACETWVLTGKDELTILIWERKV